MTQSNRHKDPTKPAAGDHLIQTYDHDAYRARGKPREPAVCGDCGAVFHKGRWQWASAAADAHTVRCPACARIHDRVPAAFLTLSGRFLQAHRNDILALIRNLEQREGSEHPLKRIMNLDDEGDRVTVQLTDPHLAKGIGDALYAAYRGELDFTYTDGESPLRVRWHRND